MIGSAPRTGRKAIRSVARALHEDAKLRALGVPIVIAGIGGSVSVVAANSWMNQPSGFTLRNGHVVAVDLETVGIDLTEEYCETARWLNQLMGLEDRISIRLTVILCPFISSRSCRSANWMSEKFLFLKIVCDIF